MTQTKPSPRPDASERERVPDVQEIAARLVSAGATYQEVAGELHAALARVAALEREVTPMIESARREVRDAWRIRCSEIAGDLDAALARVAELEARIADISREDLVQDYDALVESNAKLRGNRKQAEAELSRLREGLREILYAWEGRAEEIPTIARRLLGDPS